LTELREGKAMKRIMIVEDSFDMHEIYKDIFSDKQNEYEIELMADARAAYERVIQGGFDMVILDIIMESMDGNTFYILLRLQENERIKNMPVLVVSVLTSYDLDVFKKAGNVDFLHKPIKKEQLFTKIKTLSGYQQMPQ
jgi:CheY-like chemotaxis protein